MRRLLLWTLAAGIVLMAGGQTALAKEGHDDPREGATGGLSLRPHDLEPGQPWNATITFLDPGGLVEAEGFRPVVTLHHLGTGEVLGVPAFLERPGVYTAQIVFPQAGRWQVKLHNGFDGTIDEVTTFTLSPAPPATPSAASFPVWAWIASALASLLLVAGTFLLLPKLRRPQATVTG